MPRNDGRKLNDLRPVKITPGYIDYPEGSVLIEMGKTRVLSAVSVENQVPRWLVGQNQGWLTAEYAMLPQRNAYAPPSARRRRATFARNSTSDWAQFAPAVDLPRHRRTHHQY